MRRLVLLRSSSTRLLRALGRVRIFESTFASTMRVRGGRHTRSRFRLLDSSRMEQKMYPSRLEPMVSLPTSVVSRSIGLSPVLLLLFSYTHLRAHETPEHLVCRL